MSLSPFASSFASPLSPALRRIAATMLAIAAAFGTPVAPAFAQNEPPDDGDDAVEIVGWDLSDPVNHAESRAFFAGLWAAEDAGLPPPAFEFTNTPPGLMMAMLLPELEVFTEIYGHRLQLDFDAGERYLVTDLIADDAEVRAGFRAFVLTGKLAPRPEVDADAYLSHLDLVVDAMTVRQRASIESVESLGMLVESEGLSVEATNPSEDPPPTPMATPTEAERKCWLKYAVRSSRLSRCFSDLYEQTRETGPPDMDCDDFADAFIRYLLRSAPPGWSPHYGVIAWRCKERMQDGSIRWVVRAHALSVFRDPQGKWWFVDARKGTIGGSFDSEKALFIAMNAHCNPGPGCRSNVPGYEDHLRPIRDDVLFGLLGESKPWWQSPDRRSAFCAALRSCCGRTLGGVSGGCPLPAWAPPLPSGCDIRQYLPEPLPTWKEEWGSLEDCTATGPQ